MIQPTVGQTWEIEVPAFTPSGWDNLPVQAGEKFRVNILAVSVIDFTCTVAAPGMNWTDRWSWEFLSDFGTLVQAPDAA
jgi:hypothetical protein